LNPTTTLPSETGNNTSAANNFKAQSNGNAGAGNVSKENVHELLYPGASTKIFVNFLPWFGTSSHMNVGYDSANTSQAQRQVNDIASRGFDGIILDWFGVPETTNTAKVDSSSQAVLHAAEQHANMEVTLMLDHGAINRCKNTAGCNLTSQLIKDLNYAYQKYMQSRNYMRRGGRPVVLSFDLELESIDWARLVKSIPGNPLFVFKDVNGFSHSYSAGGYSWVGLNSNPSDMGTSYLNNFDKYGVMKFPSKLGMGSVFKGFNDNLASWSQRRVRYQQCGQTWLNGWRVANQNFNSSNQLDAMQVVTWNDYEEGTEIETGIDNCINVGASVSGSTLKWTLSGGGSESTIHHYEIFLSTDGQNLQKITEVGPGTHSLNLGSYTVPAGTYKVYVKAVGKPSIRNKMSNAATYYRSSGTSASPVLSGVSIVSPGAGTSVGSPVSISATANGSQPITAMKVYLNGAEKYAVSGTSVNTSIALASGTYNLTINAWDTTGKVYSASRSFTVGSTQASSGVTISAPASGATVGSPVRVTATAKGSHPITAMKVYMNGTLKYSTAASSVNTTIGLGAGTYTVTVNAWDTTGAVYASSRKFYVR